VTLTYAEVGATREADLPPGYHHVERELVVGRGRETFERVASALLTWQMHRMAGLSVPAATPPAAPGVEVTPRFGPLPIPCRVVYEINDKDRRGFAYGTRPGHPESGEEAFFVELSPAGEVRVHIRAFSRPGSLLTRLGGPVPRMVQRYVTGRYLEALRSIAG
jgi:uncharacterized protein (UPF0548 family)